MAKKDVVTVPQAWPQHAQHNGAHGREQPTHRPPTKNLHATTHTERDVCASIALGALLCLLQLVQKLEIPGCTARSQPVGVVRASVATGDTTINSQHRSQRHGHPPVRHQLQNPAHHRPHRTVTSHQNRNYGTAVAI